VQDQLCDEFKVMSTVLLIGMITGAVFAVDLRKRHIENRALTKYYFIVLLFYVK